MITVLRRTHKLSALLVLIAWLTSGCGTEQDRPADGFLRVEDEALRTWVDLARQLADKKTVSPEAYAELYKLPAYDLSFGQRKGLDFNRPMMKRAMEFVFRDQGKGDGGRIHNPEILSNYRYLAARLDQAENLADQLRTEGLLEASYAAVLPYLDKDQRPDSLRVLLQAATPSLSWYPPDALIVDAGLVMAAGASLPQVLAPMLFRHLAPSPLPDPGTLSDGREALIATMHQMQRHSVLAWLGDYPNLSFDPAHRHFNRDDPRRARAVSDATVTLDHVQTMLVGLLDPERGLLERVGGSVHDYLKLGRYEALGWASASLIHDRLGEGRWLQAATGSPWDWLEAYHEAAVMGDATGELAQLTPLTETTRTGLRALLQSPKTR